MELLTRKYPVGIQTFERIIKEGFVYVDKTDLVWQLAHYATFVFMSRPRRFGKSLLTSTLESYFKGDRELFEGLKILYISGSCGVQLDAVLGIFRGVEGKCQRFFIAVL